MRVLLALAALLLSGCTGLLGDAGLTVQVTRLEEAPAWNTDNRFRVVAPGHEVAIEAVELATGQRVTVREVDDATIEIPDGRWRVTYHIDGRKWDTISPVLVDVTPPQLSGLESTGNAVDGRYTIGRGAVVEAGARIEVLDLQACDLHRCLVVGRQLPLEVVVPDGIRSYRVSVRDEAGNHANATVTVRAGEAARLPEGELTVGVVARYSNTIRMWDLSDLRAYSPRGTARAAAPEYLSAGFGIHPDDPAVVAVVREVVTPGMNTAEAAKALWLWMFDNLEYDESRLDGESLLSPRQTLLDVEDPADRDEDGDGLVRDGAGNGVRGGVCRDLAAAYVSLLRAAGVPARLVSGYVGGSVDGFHAWVEFYGGPVNGQSPWVPVDVSGLDEPTDSRVDAAKDRMGAFLQSFGILSPEYLPLRTVSPDAEVSGWSTALHFRTSTPAGAARPVVSFEKRLSDDSEDAAVLCMDTVGLQRRLASDERGCGGTSFDLVSPRFLRATERTIDYGVLVRSGASGTKVEAAVALPDPAAVQPNQVTFTPYGPTITKNAQTRIDSVHLRHVASFEL